ncbi:MAG: YchJ family metal-binding protein [Dermatophilaceae bacterium]
MGHGAPNRRGAFAWVSATGEAEDLLVDERPCPCGGGRDGASLGACCGPVVRGERHAATVEQLMRSRYTAYAVADGHHLYRTWHPRTRPDIVEPDPWVRWVGLTVVEVVGGGPDDDTGIVEFRARWESGEGVTRQRGELRERSRFERRAGRWFYLAPE